MDTKEISTVSPALLASASTPAAAQALQEAFAAATAAVTDPAAFNNLPPHLRSQRQRQAFRQFLAAASTAADSSSPTANPLSVHGGPSPAALSPGAPSAGAPWNPVAASLVGIGSLAMLPMVRGRHLMRSGLAPEAGDSVLPPDARLPPPEEVDGEWDEGGDDMDLASPDESAAATIEGAMNTAAANEAAKGKREEARKIVVAAVKMVRDALARSEGGQALGPSARRGYLPSAASPAPTGSPTPGPGDAGGNESPLSVQSVKLFVPSAAASPGSDDGSAFISQLDSVHGRM
jgi:hypothetical protein